jgi:hypothetical protein
LRIEAAQPGKTRVLAGSVPELAEILGFAEILSLELDTYVAVPTFDEVPTLGEVPTMRSNFSLDRI